MTQQLFKEIRNFTYISLMLKANFSKKPAKISLVYMAGGKIEFYMTKFKFYFPAK